MDFTFVRSCKLWVSLLLGVFPEFSVNILIPWEKVIQLTLLYILFGLLYLGLRLFSCHYEV